MTYKIADIQGIGREFADKLSAAQVHTTEDLVKHASDEKAVRTLAEKSGIGEKQIEKWTGMAKLMQVSGIGPQHAELLQACGVDTVEKLRQQPAEGLLRKLTEANATRNLTNALPNIADVQRWTQGARAGAEPQQVPVR